MAKEISDLTNKAAPVGSDEVEIQETGGGDSKKATLLAILQAGINAVLGSLSTTGRITVDDTTDATNTTDGSLQTDGGLSVAKKGYFGDNVVLASGKGIDFSATSDAGGSTSELLDDYEEGTWTPDLSDGVNSDATQTIETGLYTKIGREVFCKMRLVTSSLGSVSGTLVINGLPFTSTSAATAGGGAAIGVNLNLTAGQSVAMTVITNSTRVDPYVWDAAAGVTQMTSGQWSADGNLSSAFNYTV